MNLYTGTHLIIRTQKKSLHNERNKIHTCGNKGVSSDGLGYGRWGAPWFLLTAPCLTCFANYHTCWLFFAGFCRFYGFYNGCALMDSRYHPYGHLIDAYLTRPFLCPEWPWEQWPASRFRCQLIAQYTKWWWSTIKYMLWENFCNILCSQFTFDFNMIKI